MPEAAEPGTDRFMRGPCRIDTTWQITEEADGTITVSPSIAVATSADGGNVWHGYLEHGQWRSVE